MIDKKFCEKVSSASLGGYDVKYNTWDLCERAIKEGIQGDFVECGVYKGAHPMIMAEVCKRMGEERTIRLFDSFVGVPKVRQKRDLVEEKAYGKSLELESSGVALATVEHCKMAFRYNDVPLDNCEFHVGWFQDTVPFTDWPKIAVLRLDVDLLESNEICVRNLYPKLQKGGYFITDDYGKDGTGTADIWRAEFERLIPAFKKLEIHQVENESGTAWWQKI